MRDEQIQDRKTSPQEIQRTPKQETDLRTMAEGEEQEMTPPLLEHPLVKKYFSAFGEGETMAQRVLNAMQEPYFEGDKFLHVEKDGVAEKVADRNGNHFHGFMLKLPKQFQPPPEREHEHYYCLKCNSEVDDKGKALKPPSPAKQPSEMCCYLTSLPGKDHDRNCPKQEPETAKPECIQCGNPPLGICGAGCFCKCHKPEAAKCEYAPPFINSCRCSKHTCQMCENGNPHVACMNLKPTPAPSAVEAKLKEIVNHGWHGNIEKQLRELVALVRQEGKNV